jgi:PLD-like domain
VSPLSDDRGLTDIALPDLEALLGLIDRERIRCPVTEAALASHGLEHVFERIASLGDLDGPTLRTVLRVSIAERRHRPVPRVDLVWTGPEALVSTARDTLVVVKELFEGAQKNVLIGGYAFDHGKDIFAPLHKAMKDRGVETVIFVNTVEGFLEKNWPFGEPLPEIYSDPRTADAESRVSLHAKCIVVDESKALVTSANFTDRGQTRNIEMGVLIDDPDLASRLVQQWRGLIESGLVVREVSGSV